VQNCLLMRVEDTREGWGNFLDKGATGLMSGAGIGACYSLLRPEGARIKKTGGYASGPIALMQAMNEVGRASKQGGDRRAAIWAGLNWNHADIFKFIDLKNWSPEVRALKAKDFNFPATMDGTNISVQLDDLFFHAYGDEQHTLHSHAQATYWTTVKQMLKTGEPGFSINTGADSNETLRNACTEITSEDDSDICNLGSINMSRITSLQQMARVVELGTYFLMAGTVYSDLPYAKVADVREKNRRLGLGLMGLHEWLLQRGLPYAPCAELAEYMEIYATSTTVAHRIADEWGVSRPVKTRAVAPTGTIGIIAETTTGIEPVFCVAYKRRYAKGSVWNYQYVIDPTAKKLIDAGVAPDSIEDAYSLAEDGGEKRVQFQTWLQQYVDHSISSTINLPQWGSELNNDSRVQSFGKMLIKYLPQMRGITVYPDGARGGQPLNPVKYSTAIKHVGEIFVEAMDICDLTKGGGCGS
jgi:ribonucleoside-diphosphate reductase alpha chain